MAIEIVFMIKLISTNNGSAFELKTSDLNLSIYIFDFIGNRQFSLYNNNLKLMEAKSLTNRCDYSIKYGSSDLISSFRFYSKYKASAGYKVTRKRSHLNDKLNWSWNYSTATSGYELINKLGQDRVIARISGISLDGQESGMLCILRAIPEFYRIIIIFTACIILNRNLLNPWCNFTRFLNFKEK